MKTLTKNLTACICVIALLFQLTPANGQQTSQYSIEGRVTDTLNQALDYATMNLLRAADSSVAQVMFTDENVNYSFTNLKAGTYLVQAEFLGFTKTTSAKI